MTLQSPEKNLPNHVISYAGHLVLSKMSTETFGLCQKVPDNVPLPIRLQRQEELSLAM